MSPINQLHSSNFPCQTTPGSAAKGPFRLHSPHSSIQVVVLSGADQSAQGLTLSQMVDLANQAVQELQLNPTHTVWVEHTPSNRSSSRCASFNLIHFDWQADKALSPHRSPIHEDWYLAWLENEMLLR